METFDRVDENDNVIGRTDKQEAHELAYIHRVVAVFVFTQNGELYMQEHIKTGNAYDHSAGGHVLSGETYDDAAKREAEEELGITEPTTKLGTFLSKDGRGHMFGLYEVTVPSSWKFKPNDEVEKIIPMSIPDIVRSMNEDPSKFTRGFRWTMNEYIKLKNLPQTINQEALYSVKEGRL